MRRLLAIVVIALCGAVPSSGQQTASEAARAGWDALNSRRIQEAAAIFDEALKVNPRDQRLLLGAAVAARLQGRTEDERRTLVDLLAVNPASTSAALLLGDVLYRSGDIDSAISVYEQALSHTPDQPQLARRLAGWRKEAALHSRFGLRYGDHFAVLFEGPAEAVIADRAVAILEAAYWRIGTALAAYPTEVVTVVLYTREQFRDITSSPDWAGGAFDGRIRVPVRGAQENPQELERVLSHEFTHALVRSLAPRGVPVWLDEGLAVMFEGGEGAATRNRVSPSREREPIPLARLEGSFATLANPDVALAYAESAAAVQAMIDESGAAAVVSLLLDIGAGVPFREAFDRRMLFSYADFQQRVQRAR